MFNILKNKENTKTIIKEIYSKNEIKRYVMLFSGLIMLSIAFNLFLLPNNIVFGGVSGLSIITKRFFNWDPSVFILVSSIVLLIISFFTLEKEKTRGSVLGSILFPVFVKITAFLPSYFEFNSSDLLICVLFGGALYGIGAGLIFKAGFTTGGTDIINQIIAKYFKTSMGNALIFSDGFIVLFGAFVFGLNKLMYSIIALYLISLLTDKVMIGISDSKAFYIITENVSKISEYILKELGHGVTVFDGKGGFSKSKQKVILCVIPTKEYFKLKAGIHLIDPSAFFVATDAYEVLGGE